MDPTRPLTIPSINPFLKSTPSRLTKKQNQQSTSKDCNEQGSSNDVMKWLLENYEDCGGDASAMPIPKCGLHKLFTEAHPEKKVTARDFENLVKKAFPNAKLKKVGVVGVKTISFQYVGIREKVFCICRQPSSGLMIKCSNCSEWYHNECINVKEEDIEILQDYICESCQITSNGPPINSQVTRLNVLAPTKKNKRRSKLQNKSKLTPSISNTDFLEILTSCKAKLKLVPRIPRAARTLVATKLTATINKCTSENSLSAWQELFLFPYRVFHVTDEEGHMAKKIKINTKNIDSPIIFRNNQKRKTKIYSIARHVEFKISQGNVRGAIRLMSSEDKLASNNATTLQSLEEKHPNPSNQFVPPHPLDENDITQSLVVNTENVRKAIASFQNGSSGGVDGLSPQHLKDLTSTCNGVAGEELIKALTKLSNFMLEGKVNDDFISTFYGASLIALNKKDGGLRPIAIGCTLRRLVSKLRCQVMGENLVDEFIPHQVGFKVKGGAEAVVHAVRTYVEKDVEAEILIKIDVKNAFNSVSRDVMLDKIKTKLPAVYPYLYQCYASPSNLFYNDNVILSKTGCQQGDPCGPGIFSLTINDTLNKLFSKLNV
ncbi:unnamed protein product [Orchesella dallaii]|uniref:PHD-type domain-containing protein n=1 Tax=Orchesella dallaii TaxID=48710 RepID=A0ABP1QQF5_9HEXA